MKPSMVSFGWALPTKCLNCQPPEPKFNVENVEKSQRIDSMADSKPITHFKHFHRPVPT